jgi:hypothetical protein
MKDLLEKLKHHLTEEGMKGLLKFLVFPVIALVLVLVIVVADKPEKENSQQVAASEESQSGISEETIEEEPVWVLEEEAVPEIHSLLNLYLRSRRTCDINGLAEVYGNTYDSVQLQNQRAEMEEDVKFYQRFEDLVCYTVPGLADGQYVVYARYNIKFRQAETLAPSLMVGYVRTAADGTVYLEADLSSAERELIDKVNESPEVQAMAKEVNESLRTALESDTNLLSMYYMMLDMEVVENQEEDGETQGTVIIGPTEEAGPSEPTAEGESGSEVESSQDAETP